ncbi:Avirulence (Avh) protein [Phytophthora cinnamomi]|uniref:Avirulence (Avh) protein n=1 Tax=Phytophthora cinnamomi TaxID=4785 RepID=UPI00355988A8|nr:Avirulence (Avh) protein [Phytophthora cinnamomi]
MTSERHLRGQEQIGDGASTYVEERAISDLTESAKTWVQNTKLVKAWSDKKKMAKATELLKKGASVEDLYKMDLNPDLVYEAMDLKRRMHWASVHGHLSGLLTRWDNHKWRQYREFWNLQKGKNV